ncbi:ABC transporter permease [Pediococcus damnosus]|uniref:FtsX-like permease family protein n=1 Tax=Pediococcus damnosus TaxID=51663 RepID=UPI00117568BF|nr:FtsX-like permease family protein [Pediococcus damnosus]GEA92215.1 ABC transporter permease [Pediococcus damnosus]
MLFKLAFVNVRDRWRDYLVLFFGLIISAAIFYMFEAIATNKALIQANISFKLVVIVFQFGSVLLGIITLVYIVYANSFLMTMREHDYGLFMMLGGKKSRLGLLIFTETLLIGLVSTGVGVLVGIGLTQGLSQLLMTQLGVQITKFTALNNTACLSTILFFVILFLVASIINQHKILHRPVLRLLKGNSEADKPMKVTVWRYIEGVIGIGLLAVGYWAMAKIEILQLMAIPIALVTIVLGTYFLFNALFQLLIYGLKTTNLAFKGLNGFTLGQLNFRIRDYTKMLSVVSILFALALGAITVGMGYHRIIPVMAKSNTAYDLAVYKQTPQATRLVHQLDLQEKQTYRQKIKGTTIYFVTDDFQKQPFEMAKVNKEKVSNHRLTLNQLKHSGRGQEQLLSLQTNYYELRQIKFVSQKEFQTIQAKPSKLVLIKTTGLAKSAKILNRIAKNQVSEIKNPQVTIDSLGGAYPIYQSANIVFGGLEFVGFFLGMAFLTMLASCLMFKILSGAQLDKRRYQMLNRLGTRQKLIRKSIRREIGVLFFLPGVLGVVHVLFGLKMFVPLMGNPYTNLATPFTIFICLYLIYYLITVLIYEKLVVPTVRMQF